MKIRIKSNSIRFRLTKSDVSNLALNGYLQEETHFPQGKFVYALKVLQQATELAATINTNQITMLVPAAFINNWPQNNVTGTATNVPLPENKSLYLLLEKDFVCLDETAEDQSDNFENPNKF